MNKYARCLWIVNTLNDYGKCTLKELNERWINADLNYEGEEILPRTFFRDKEFIESTFQLDINYDKRLRKYELVNSDEIKGSSLMKYLLGNFHVSHLSAITMKHKDKVMIQDVNTGIESLSIVLDAIDRKRTLLFKYTSYYQKDKVYDYEVIPCFVRLFEHRWYLICEYLDRSQTRVLALERMQDIEVGKKERTASPEINPKDFYKDCFGIIRDDKTPVCVRIKVYDKQVDYVRSLPIHTSQKEIETGEGYAIFEYRLRPSYDFVQHLLWHKKMEVLTPLSLREEMKKELEEMLGRYNR